MNNTSVSNVGVFLAASQESAYFRGWTDALITAYEEVRTMETCSGITAVEVRKDALKAIDVCKGFVALQVGADDEHLPECPLSRPRDVDCGCVCHLLRACEQRVREDFKAMMFRNVDTICPVGSITPGPVNSECKDAAVHQAEMP